MPLSILPGRRFQIDWNCLAVFTHSLAERCEIVSRRNAAEQRALKDEQKQKNYALAEKLLSEQNFASAVAAGAIAALLAAIAYGIAVSVWPVFYGFAAAGVGLLVGLAMGFLGRGIETKFTVLAVAYTIIGCVLGNAFMQVLNVARATRTSPLDVLQNEPVSILADWLISGLSLVHAIYWLVAIVCAGFLAKRPLSRADRLALGLYQVKD